jgi:hypothetical protein
MDLDSCSHTASQCDVGFVNPNDNRAVSKVLQNDDLRSWDKTQRCHSLGHSMPTGDSDDDSCLASAQETQRRLNEPDR